MSKEESEKILEWIKTFDVKPIETEGMSQEGIIISNEIFSKFQKFISWSEEKIVKTHHN